MKECKWTKLPNGGLIYENEWGSKCWLLDNKVHREDGPAVEYANGGKAWYLNGKFHREDGPAIDLSHGYKSWWLNGQHIPCTTQKEFERLLKLKAFW